jgi:hypothetical protein
MFRHWGEQWIGAGTIISISAVDRNEPVAIIEKETIMRTKKTNTMVQECGPKNGPRVRPKKMDK